MVEANGSKAQLSRDLDDAAPVAVRVGLARAEVPADSDEIRLLKERIGELEASLAEARVACATKDAFLSAISHEIRSPMSAMLGFSQLLLKEARGSLPVRNQRQVEAILRAGEHIVGLLDDVAGIACAQMVHPSSEIDGVDLGRVIREITSILQGAAGETGVRVKSLPLPDGAPKARADRRRLMQILLNLGSNAVKYDRPGGSVTLVVSLPSTDRIRIIVTDTGCGIPFDKQGSLFRPFQRAGQESSSIPGTGLGLVLARRLAEQMGGTVAFRSVPGEGSTFWVELEVHEPLASSPRVEETALPGGDARW